MVDVCDPGMLLPFPASQEQAGTNDPQAEMEGESAQSVEEAVGGCLAPPGLGMGLCWPGWVWHP